MESTKTCTKCGKEFPVSQFRLIVNPKTGRERRHSWCNKCKGKYEAAKRRAKRAAEPDGGKAFKASEAQRVRTYQADASVKERRAERSKIQYRALDELRRRYPEEYAQLQLRNPKRNYQALAALREAHREEYDMYYSRSLERAGLVSR
jgi:hypothetical protein